MTVTENDYLVQKEYYAEQRRRAARWALVRAAQKGERLHARALSWLGDRLVAWGSRLQENYDTVVSSTISKTAKPAVGQ